MAELKVITKFDSFENHSLGLIFIKIFTCNKSSVKNALNYL